MSIRVTIEGAPAIRAILRSIPNVARGAVQREVMRSALNVQGGAKERCPVDTGRLRGSITYRIDPDGMGAEVGTNVTYAPHVEFGTIRMAAQPFLYPALESERRTFYRRLREVLGAEMVRAGGRR